MYPEKSKKVWRNKMEFNEIIELLQSLLYARGACGEEKEVRKLCFRLFKEITDEVWEDPFGNLICKIAGEIKDAPAIRLMAHMDELSLIVKRINEDGSLRVDPLGGLLPGAIGQCPVDILGDHELISGVLSFGSLHITKETVTTHKMVPEEERGLGKALAWEDVKVITRKSPQELIENGVHPGTRVVMGEQRRKLFVFQDCIAGYFLDNRAAIAVCICAFKRMKSKKLKPKNDVYLVASCLEEIGGHGASYAARTLPGDLTIAIDVGPVASEYQINLTSDPIIVYQDTFSLYDKETSDHLVKLGKELGQQPQCAILGNYGSDASLAQSRGQTARSALICFSVENTHGYEIMHKESISQCANLLEAFLC